MSHECSRVLPRETIRAKPIRGGTDKCSRCDNPHLPGSAYCAPCKNAYQRDWRAEKKRQQEECSRELERLRKLCESLGMVS